MSPPALSLLSPEGKQEGIWGKRMGNDDFPAGLDASWIPQDPKSFVDNVIKGKTRKKMKNRKKRGEEVVVLCIKNKGKNPRNVGMHLEGSLGNAGIWDGRENLGSWSFFLG